MMPTPFEPEGWWFEDGDPSVGIFGSAWIHDACPASDVDEYSEAEEFDVGTYRLSDTLVRNVTRLVCPDCNAEVEVTEDDFVPTDEWLDAEIAAQAEYEAIQSLQEAQALDGFGRTRLDRAVGFQVRS